MTRLIIFYIFILFTASCSSNKSDSVVKNENTKKLDQKKEPLSKLGRISNLETGLGFKPNLVLAEITESPQTLRFQIAMHEYPDDVIPKLSEIPFKNVKEWTCNKELKYNGVLASSIPSSSTLIIIVDVDKTKDLDDEYFIGPAVNESAIGARAYYVELAYGQNVNFLQAGGLDPTTKSSINFLKGSLNAANSDSSFIAELKLGFYSKKDNASPFALEDTIKAKVEAQFVDRRKDAPKIDCLTGEFLEPKEFKD